MRNFVRRFTDDLGEAFQRLLPGKKDKFFKDFEHMSDVDLAKFNGNPGMVSAWDAVFGLEDFRKIPTKLKAVDDLVTVKQIEHTLVKSELSELPVANRKDLINSFEVANGSAPYPVLSNSLPPSTSGELYGTFVNGQFVPTSNAPVGGTWDFVVKTNGEIKVGSKHSWLANGGEDVLAAGEIKINGGIIEEITNASGHYTPTVGQGMNYLRLLKEQGVDVSSAHLYLGQWDSAGNYIDVRNVHPFAPNRSLYD